MGGNAFKNPTRRVSTKEYNEIIEELLPILAQHYGQVDTLNSLPTKQDHGDIDILVSDQQPIDLAVFTPQQTNNQYPILSFEYKNVQVDLIHSKNIELAKFCLSYSDFGIIFGYLLKPHNLKLNDNGLVYKLYISPNKLEIIHLSDNPRDICDCFGLDYEKYGFGSEEKVFEWFGNEWPAKELKSTQRRQEKKREMFSRFLDWQHDNKSTVNDPASEEHPTKLAQHAIAYFKREEELKEAIKSKPKEVKLVDGQRIMNVLQLPPSKTVGLVLKKINETDLEGKTEPELDALIVSAFNSLNIN
ncbi:hypothetical protein HDV01_001963 [Terramyces sp. JEL0728]|nr:hypothetical protein HDV01_001963 [Terramyces sp. JEL0728]